MLKLLGVSKSGAWGKCWGMVCLVARHGQGPVVGAEDDGGYILSLMEGSCVGRNELMLFHIDYCVRCCCCPRMVLLYRPRRIFLFEIFILVIFFFHLLFISKWSMLREEISLLLVRVPVHVEVLKLSLIFFPKARSRTSLVLDKV
jgi:hypothetical protein